MSTLYPVCSIDPAFLRVQLWGLLASRSLNLRPIPRANVGPVQGGKLRRSQEGKRGRLMEGRRQRGERGSAICRPPFC